MNLKTWMPLALALVLGLAAMIVGSRLMSGGPQQAAANTGTEQVVVPLHDVLPGSQLHAEDLKVAHVGADGRIEGSFANVADLEGRTVKVAMVRNQTIVEQLLVDKTNGQGLSGLIPDGMRAITIEVNEFSGVAGMVTPGCRVDVMATMPGDGPDAGANISRAVVQNVLVQAVGQRMSDKTPKAEGEVFRSVTLVATPKQAAAIELAASSARPRLLLRNGKDNVISDSAMATAREIRGSNSRNTGGSDPFVAKSGSPLPATNALLGGAPGKTGESRRAIKVIRGGVETEVMVDEAVEPTTTTDPAAAPGNAAPTPSMVGTQSELGK